MLPILFVISLFLPSRLIAAVDPIINGAYAVGDFFTSQGRQLGAYQNENEGWYYGGGDLILDSEFSFGELTAQYPDPNADPLALGNLYLSVDISGGDTLKLTASSSISTTVTDTTVRNENAGRVAFSTSVDTTVTWSLSASETSSLLVYDNLDFFALLSQTASNPLQLASGLYFVSYYMVAATDRPSDSLELTLSFAANDSPPPPQDPFPPDPPFTTVPEPAMVWAFLLTIALPLYLQRKRVS